MCRVVSGQVCIRRSHPKTAQHSNNLPAMKTGVIDRVKHNLPAWHPEQASVRQNSRDLATQIILRSRLKPSAITLPKLRPRLKQKLKRVLRSGTRRQAIIIDLHQSTKPDALPVMNMAEGLQNTCVRCPRIPAKLRPRERRTDLQHPPRSPGGVPDMRKQ